MALSLPPIPSEALLSLTRQEQHLQTHIQTLLDAQSAGLLAGLGHPSSSIDDYTPSSSPARLPPRPKSVTPIRQPPSKKITLRGARRGISRAIADLATIKSQQADLLEAELEDRGQDLEVIESMEKKQEGLSEAIAHIEAAPTTSRITSLRSEEQTLSAEIRDMETRLYQMKARQRHLSREIQGLDNSIQAKLSSYRESLRMAEKEAKGFLERPPEYVSGKGEEEKGFWALPRERRTLEMAGEDLRSRRGDIRGRLRGSEAESVALEEGREVWDEVCENVNGVERGLREEMRGIGTRGRDGEGPKGMKRVLEMMDRAKREIEEKLDIAEQKNWRLLVCCIGAELEALIEGEGVLRAALEDAGGGDDEMVTNGHAGIPNGLEQSRSSENGVRLTQESPELSRRLEEEDDQPGPDLLIAHQDTD